MSILVGSRQKWDKFWVLSVAGFAILILVALSVPNLLRVRGTPEELHRYAAQPETFQRARSLIQSAATTAAPIAASAGESPASVTADRKIVRTSSVEMTVASPVEAAEKIRALVDGEWKTVASGTTVGHKKIDIFPPITATSVRLVVRASLGPVLIRNFDVFNGAVAK